MPTSIMSSNLQQLRHFLADLLTGVARMAVSERMPCPRVGNLVHLDSGAFYAKDSACSAGSPS